MKRGLKLPGALLEVMFFTALLAGLYLISLHNFLLFHSLADLLSVAVGFSIFILAWNSRRILENNYLLFIGMAYLSVSALSTIHILSYRGMGIFLPEDANLSTQLWIASRYLLSLSYLTAPYFLNRRLSAAGAFLFFMAATALLFGSIFRWGLFPLCYIEGTGLTPFKIYSEYLISAIFLISLALLYRNRVYFDDTVLKLTAASLLLAIGAELTFTFYISVYGLSNLAGHLANLLSFYMIYKAVIETGFSKPYGFLFRSIVRQQEALAESEQRFRVALKHSPIVVFNQDKDLRYTWIYNAAKWHYTNNVVGKMDVDFMSRKSSLRLQEIKRRVLEEGIGSREEVMIETDGDAVYYDLTVEPLADNSNNICGITCAAWDITDMKRTEMALQERTEQLENANSELESFSYSVSHDLRAPLRAIDGYSRMILRNLENRLDEEIREKFTVIRSNAQMMGQLIDDLLAFSRLSRKELAVTRLDMEYLFGDAWKELEVINPGRDIRLEIDGMPSCYGDRMLIKQVCLNLLSNAVKFTCFEEKATVRIGGSVREDEIEYYVRDNGIGFDMAYYNKLFGVFQRLHSTNDFEGTGVGLAIVKRVIQRHGGRVWAEGKLGEGACFHFAMPRKERHFS